jgi:Tfp pilus assembly protein PilV
MKCQKVGTERGFSLLEALVVGVLLLISIIGILQIYSVTFYNAPKVDNLMMANYILTKEVEIVLAQTYTTLDNFLSSNYPKIVNYGNVNYTITYTLLDNINWGKYIRIINSWREGKENKNLSIELFKAKL